MPKRIHIQHLTLGMYLHEFCGSWMDHPFWRAKFLLKDPKDLARIQATAIQEIWIDTDKGLDVAEGTASMSREEVDAQIETDFSRLEDLPPIKVTLPSPPRPPSVTASRPTCAASSRWPPPSARSPIDTARIYLNRSR